MPQIYTPNPQRSRSSSSSSSSSTTAAPRPIDADDSIVLSDLLRTGEASRLRRRGAMRIDPATYLAGPVRAPSLFVAERPSWDTEYDFDFATIPEHLERNASLRSPRRRQRSTRRYGPYAAGATSQSDAAHSLVCGQQIHSYDSDFEPFKPSILPLYPDGSNSQTRAREVNRSTGCGSLVHDRAAPRPRFNVWTAYSTASSAVVSLEASYFETREAAKFVRSSCGCVREGIGCAICGNPLGTRYIPCKSAADTFFCSRNNDKTQATPASVLRGPEGPQYRQPSGSDHTIYTFFSNAVTPTPAYEFPPIKTRIRGRGYSDVSLYSDRSHEPIYSPPPALVDFLSEDEDEEAPLQLDWHPGPLTVPDNHSGSAMIFDRFSASSPAPLSDIGEESNAPRTYSHPRRPRIHPDEPVLPPVSFYQQQVIGAWERERQGVSRPAGFDPDGEAFVWGATNPDIEEPGSPDKSHEHLIFPER